MSTPPKRSLSLEDASVSDPKRPRLDAESRDAPAANDRGQADDESRPVECRGPSPRDNAICGLQRSIALALRHDGFSSATREAMESFTGLVESYLESLIKETKRFALAARREHPIPTDFELMLRYHNLPTSSLRPHLRNPIARDQLAPTYLDVGTADNGALATLPLLCPGLSGQADKDTKPFIPSSFPDFPSRHTYRFTPKEDTGARDSKKIREEAARTAQHGEDALRRLVRASKVRKQKEVKSLVQHVVQGKERFRLWEATMRRFMGADSRGENMDQLEIADHSMIVNGDAVFARKEVPRLGKRSAGLPTNGPRWASGGQRCCAKEAGTTCSFEERGQVMIPPKLNFLRERALGVGVPKRADS